MHFFSPNIIFTLRRPSPIAASTIATSTIATSTVVTPTTAISTTVTSTICNFNYATSTIATPAITTSTIATSTIQLCNFSYCKLQPLQIQPLKLHSNHCNRESCPTIIVPVDSVCILRCYSSLDTCPMGLYIDFRLSVFPKSRLLDEVQINRSPSYFRGYFRNAAGVGLGVRIPPW